MASSSEPIKLIDQWRLLLAATSDAKLSRGDLAVLGEIVDRYMKKKGNSRASYTHLARAAELNIRSAKRSVRKLLDLGYIKVDRLGAGTRPTEYIPSFVSGVMGDTSTSDGADVITEATSVSPLGDGDGTSGSPHNPTYLPGLQPADGKRESSTGVEAGARVAAPPPLAPSHDSGSEGHAPRDPFDELWAIWPLRRDCTKAKAAFLGTDSALYSEIITSAERLARTPMPRTALIEDGRNSWRIG